MCCWNHLTRRHWMRSTVNTDLCDLARNLILSLLQLAKWDWLGTSVKVGVLIGLDVNTKLLQWCGRLTRLDNAVVHSPLFITVIARILLTSKLILSPYHRELTLKMAPSRYFFAQIPAVILSTEFFLGGVVRLSSWPFRDAHEQVCRKNAVMAPILYPVVPFTDVTWHNRWVGTWLLITGALVASKDTRRSRGTLALQLFWSGALGYSQWKAGSTFWLPGFNIALGLVVWWIENSAGKI